MIVEAKFTGKVLDNGAKVLALPEMAGKWISENCKLLTEPDVDESGRLVALANVYGMLAFVELRVRIKEGKVMVCQQG